MKITLEAPSGIPLLTQEVLFTGRMPELIRWENKIFAHRFTSWPQQTSAYREQQVLDMPAPLPPEILQQRE